MDLPACKRADAESVVRSTVFAETLCDVQHRGVKRNIPRRLCRGGRGNSAVSGIHSAREISLCYQK